MFEAAIRKLEKAKDKRNEQYENEKAQRKETAHKR